MSNNVKLEDLNLQNDNRLAVKTVKFNNVDIDIKQYIGISDKYVLSQSVAYACLEEEGKIVNTIKKEVITVLDIIAAYTNIEFTMPETLPEIYSLFDALVMSKDEEQNITLYDLVISNIPEKEIKELKYYIDKVLEYVINYNNSVGSLFMQIKNFINSLDGSALELVNELYNKSIGKKSDEEIEKEQKDEALEKIQPLTEKVIPISKVENNNSQGEEELFHEDLNINTTDEGDKK